MDKFIMDVELPDGTEKEIELDVSSLGDIDSYDSADLKEEIKYLIKKTVSGIMANQKDLDVNLKSFGSSFFLYLLGLIKRNKIASFIIFLMNICTFYFNMI